MSASKCTSNKPYFPLAGGATDGFSNENNASATCFCGAVQLQFVSRHLLSSSFDLRPGRRDPSLVLTLIAWPRLQDLRAPGFVDSFLCNCTDCRKLTAATSAANFVIRSDPPHLIHLRGEANLSQFGIASTTRSGLEMVNYFCKTCGTLMYRRGDSIPGLSILRLGTVDDFRLAEGVLKPRVEIFTETRVGWASPAEGAKQIENKGWSEDA
jgi:hypothetical protein